MVKGFRIKGLASIMLARVFCFCAAVPVLAAGTVRSLNLRFEDQYELGVIVEPEITCVSAGISHRFPLPGKRIRISGSLERR